LAVEGERGFERDERKAGANPLGKTFVGRLGLLCEAFDELNFDAGAFQRCEPSPSNLRIRIFHRRINIFYSGRDNGFGARAGAASGAARLQGHVERCASRFFPSFFQRDDFRVVATVIDVEAFAYYAAILYEDCADNRIRMRKSETSLRQIEGALHVRVVRRGIGASRRGS
jgi:hypothetical protein